MFALGCTLSMKSTGRFFTFPPCPRTTTRRILQQRPWLSPSSRCKRPRNPQQQTVRSCVAFCALARRQHEQCYRSRQPTAAGITILPRTQQQRATSRCTRRLGCVTRGLNPNKHPDLTEWHTDVRPQPPVFAAPAGQPPASDVPAGAAMHPMHPVCQGTPFGCTCVRRLCSLAACRAV
jgi:hypothetical protein